MNLAKWKCANPECNEEFWVHEEIDPELCPFCENTDLLYSKSVIIKDEKINEWE